MFKKVMSVILAGGLVIGAAACAGPNQKQQTGTVVGAIIGGLAGSQIGSGSGRLVAVGVGTLAGALIGSEVGRQLDERDRLLMERTHYETLESYPTGQTNTWSNPDTGHYGTVTPTRTYEASSGQNCREYQTTVTIGGKEEQAYGTACRQPDGSWQIQG